MYSQSGGVILPHFRKIIKKNCPGDNQYFPGRSILFIFF
ncbi:hypothetical protein AR1Y2_3454 [Anaerostipes rhamnosivorans]|uniref:Uncharacterized protein n=1 Tax=Anaerostipes rhamnosivorans TaxID=1229621 RepID=A0A4P8IG97_9FIRM|nr:hypothetical protein AR1Y2_3454 [Anaerostipes rhamnosivorans]